MYVEIESVAPRGTDVVTSPPVKVLLNVNVVAWHNPADANSNVEQTVEIDNKCFTRETSDSIVA